MRCGALCYGALAALLLWSADPQRCRAEDDAPSIVGYAFEGMGTGLATGLAIGYLSSGHEWKSNEWRKLAWGTAIGGLAGLGTGLVLGVVDASSGRPRSYGFYMVRDSNYGFSVGAVAGGIIGALLWLGDGTGKDLLRGLAWGTVIGAGSGLLLGVLEAALRNSSASSEKSNESTDTAQGVRMQVGLGFMPTGSGAPVPYPSLSGRF
jgi:hypothetical protein